MDNQKQQPKKLNNDKMALIIVDVQYDFCPGGALAVSDGDKIVPAINELIPLFKHIVTTQDWHPADHCSFAEPPKFTDKSWPKHCVRDTKGAMLHLDLKYPFNTIFVHKGMDKDAEEYSGFQGYVYKAEKKKFGEEDRLIAALKAREVDQVFIVGLATDYCVKATALDAVKHGLKTQVLQPACRGVAKETTAAAIAEMQAAGVLVWTDDLVLKIGEAMNDFAAAEEKLAS